MLTTVHFFYLLSILFLFFLNLFSKPLKQKTHSLLEGGLLRFVKFLDFYSYAAPSMLSPSLAPHVGCAIKRTLHLEVRFSDLCEYDVMFLIEYIVLWYEKMQKSITFLNFFSIIFYTPPLHE
jgi:hypothetical protein